MERLIEEPVDYDPFADDPTASAPAPLLPATKSGETPAPAVVEEVKPAASDEPAIVPEAPAAAAAAAAGEPVVIPEAPALPEVIDLNQRKKEQASKRNFKEEPVDYDPFPAEPEPDSWGDPADYALIRGGMEGLRGIEGGKDFVTVLDMSFSNMTPEEKLKVILAQDPDTGPDRWARREPSIAGVRSPGELLTWFQESAGSATVSSMPSLIGGAAGTIGGAALAGPVGAAIGAYGGAALPSMVLGISGMYQDLRQNDGVRKALQNGTLTVDQFQKLTYLGGLMTGALDAIPASHFAGKALGLDMVKKEIKETLIRAAIKGVFEEGGTESLQQAVSEVTQKGAGGNTSLAQAMINIVDAGLQGMVGGGIFGAATRGKGTVANEGEKNPAKPDDVPGVSTTAQPEGTPASVKDGEAASQDTPGSTIATTPAPAAGTDQQPDEQPGTTDVPPTDPRTIAKPPKPAEQPGVTVITGDQVDPAIATTINPAAGAGPSVTPVAPAIPEEEEEHDVRTTVLPGEEDMAQSAQEARIRQMFEQSKATEKAAERTTPAVPGADVNAAIQASSPTPQGQQPAQVTAPIIPAPTAPPRTAAQQETLGTGQALGETPPVGPTPPAAVTPEVQEAAPAQPLERAPTPPVEEPAAPVETALPAPEIAEAPQAPAEAPLAAALKEKKKTKAERQAENKLAHAAKAEALKEEARLKREAKEAAAAAKKAAKQAPKAAAPKAAPVTSAEPAPSVAEVTAPAEAPKVAALKAKAKPKPAVTEAPAEAPAAAPQAEVVTRKQLEEEQAAKARAEAARKAAEEAELEARRKAAAGPQAAKPEPPKAAVLKRKKPVVVTREAMEARRAQEAPGAQPTAEHAPAAAAEPATAGTKAVKTPLSRDLADQARRDVIDRSDENTLPPKWHARAEEVAAEVARDNPRPPDRSPREHIAALKGKVADRVHAEMQDEARAKLAEAEDRAIAAAHEETRDVTKEKETEKRQQQAAAEKPQQKERFTLGKEKSAAGMRGESEKAIRRSAEAEEKGLPEAARNPHLAAWLALDRKIKDPETPARDKPQLISQRNAMQEARIAAAEGTDLKARAARAERQIAAARPPTTPELPNDGTAEKTMADHFKAFLKATGDVDVSSRVSLKYNSRLENLVIFARKLAGQSDEDTVPNGNQFYVVQKLLEAGEHEIFDNEIRSNSGIGSEEQAGEVEDTGESGARLAEDKAPEFETQALRRGGREGALTREQAREARDQRRTKEYDEVTGLHDPQGRPVEAMGTTTTGAAALREVEARARELGIGEHGFLPMLRSMLVRHLSNIVGDIEINFVSAETMREVDPTTAPGTPGFYMDYSDQARAAGRKPRIVLNEEIQWDHAAFNHTVLHEMMHAATSQAMRHNLRGIDKIIGTMRAELKQQLSDAGLDEATLKATGINYAFTNNMEFLAEAFSNPRFQEILGQLVVTPKLRAQVAAIKAGRTPTWWDSFVAAVSHAIGMVSGTRGHSYMEQLIKVAPSVMRTSAGQQTAAREEVARIRASRPASSLFDARPLVNDVDNVSRGVLAWARDTVSGMRDTAADLGVTLDVDARDRVNTTAGMWRDAQQLWGNGTELFQRYAEIALRKDSLMKQLRQSPGVDEQGNKIDSQGLERKTLDYMRTHTAEYKLLGRYLKEATTYGYNPFAPLTDVSNGHISKAGDRDIQVRAAHARAREALKTMPDHMVAMGKELREHFIKTRELEAKANVREMIQNVLDKNKTTLPPGVSLDRAVEWVRSNAARRKVEERDAFDKQMHDHLGRIAATIAEVPELMKIPGTYVPLLRRGKYFVSAVEKVFDEANLPKGAVADWAKGDPLAKKNRLMFTDQKALKAFVESHPDQVKVQTKWVDENGRKIHHKEPNARKIYFATVQNRSLRMGSFREMQRHREQMIADGHEAATVRLTGRDLKGAMPQIASPQVMRLLNAVDQTTIGQSEVAKEALKGAILDAHIRTLSSRGHLQRNLKRRNVKGAEDDLFQGLQNYNTSLASSMANKKIQRQLGEAEGALHEWMNKDAYNDVGKGSDKRAIRRQSQVKEIGTRIANFGGFDGETRGEKLLSNVRNYTALTKLTSPAFGLVQVLQNEGQALPALAAISNAAGRPVGFIKAKSAQWRAMQAFGGMTRNIIKGARHAGQTALGTNIGDQDQAFYDAVKNHKEAAGLTRTFDLMNEFDFGASNANETGDLSSVDKSTFTRGMMRTTNAAMAIPTAIERVNRYSTAAAAYELYRSTGMSEEQAAVHAAMKVEEGQLAYGAGNYPKIFRNPWFNAAFQFRKYSLGFGNVFWRTFSRALPGITLPGGKVLRTAHPEARGARKQLAGMTLFTAAMAGAYGTAFIEPLRMITNALFAAGWSDDDWETKEDEFQVWLGKMFKWATGSSSIGNLISEAVLRGPTRLLNIDMSNSMGQDSLLMYKQPQHMDKEGFLAWLAKSMIGAPGNMIVDAVQDIHNGNYGELPIPKIIRNLVDGVGLYWDGIRNKATGEKVAKTNLVDTAVAMFGLKPAKEAEQWEPGGSGYGSKQLKKAHAERRDMMAHWRSLGPGAKQRYFQTTIRNYNRTAREPIQYQDLVRSERSAKGYSKRVEEYAD